MVHRIRTRGIFIEYQTRQPLSHGYWLVPQLSELKQSWENNLFKVRHAKKAFTLELTRLTVWESKTAWVCSKLYHIVGLFFMHPAHVEYVKVTFTETVAHMSTWSCTRYLSPYYYYQNVSIIYPTTVVEIVRIVSCVHRRPCFVSWSIVNKSLI